MNESINDEKPERLYTKTIYELLGENFFIPSYQRGYRWSGIQVRELLEDIWEFSRKEGDKAEFYCLQPIVVVKRADSWEVVDGQQRLTTLYVILHYLEKEHLRRDIKEAFLKPLFSMRYETRQGSEHFLKNIQNELDTGNIDFYHISNAYLEVKRWFSEHDYNDNNSFLATLLAKPNSPNPVKVIWYDLSEECKESDYAIDVFSRINIGKIPLTNAELIRALFLQHGNVSQESPNLKQIQIATEWDFIEQSLQEPSFWHFIYNSNNEKEYDTHIELIFDLMKRKPAGAETLFTFHKFNLAFKESKAETGRVDVDSLWKEVKDYFLTFEQWYRDRDLYHLIGFLVDCGHSIQELKATSEARNSTKTAFKSYLKNEISKKVNFQLDELSYGDKKLRRVLLLFNIQTLLATQEADVRFPFDRYKEENWDIEHIRSQITKDVKGAERKEWLEDVFEYFTGTRDYNDIDEKSIPRAMSIFVKPLLTLLKSEKIDDKYFNNIYQKITSHFQEDETAGIDGLGNLTLLDSTTNRSYGNALFPIKRKRIIHNDMNGVFVPICTKNVFMKFYSKTLSDVMYWQETDAVEYVDAIKLSLKEYLPVQGEQA